MPSRHSRFQALPKLLFRHLSSFMEFEARVSQLPEELDRGDALEIFVEAFLHTDPIWQIDDLWLVGQVPLDVRNSLNLSQNTTGIDGVFRRKSGELVPYQVKFRIGRPQVAYTEVSTFFGLTERASRRVLISNCDRYAKDVVARDRIGFINGSDLDELSADRLRLIEEWLAGRRTEPERKRPLPQRSKPEPRAAKSDQSNTALGGKSSCP